MNLVKRLMKLILKTEVVDKLPDSDLSKIKTEKFDLYNSKNLLSLSSINIGTAAGNTLSDLIHSYTGDLSFVGTFRKQCRGIISSLLAKIFERVVSDLYFLKNASCLNPKNMLAKSGKQTCLKQMEKLGKTLAKNK